MKKLLYTGLISAFLAFGSNAKGQESIMTNDANNVKTFGRGIEKKLAGPEKNGLEWKKIDEGLHYTQVKHSDTVSYKDEGIKIIKIDPKEYNFELLSSGESDKERQKKAGEWSKKKNLIAVINAGMFQGFPNRDKSTGFMKDSSYINNGEINNDGYNAMLALNPKSDSVPRAQIIDMKCDNWNDLNDDYHSYLQGIRMIGCKKNNVWTQQPERWSIASIGFNGENKALLMFSRSPYSIHDFNEKILNSNLDIKKAMYLEGGPEASLYLNRNDYEISSMGSYETGFNEDNKNEKFWHIPNVIGVKKRGQ